ncbi:MAG: hypothetical protein JW720_02135 [Sedimentisphaerales bacterium]|nr:hypothetical protein [Sedimentisphaerales bacterium]
MMTSEIRTFASLAILVIASPSLCSSAEPDVSGGAGQELPAITKVWDTQSPLEDEADLPDRTNWKIVPSNLLSLEADPAAAVSDPGYYGREYSFKGDAVVENAYLKAVFHSKKGKVVIYSQGDPGNNRVDFVPLQLKGKRAIISRCSILRNTGDEVSLEASFCEETGRDDLSAILSFDGKRIVEISPAEDTKGISLPGTIEYGVAPAFIGDDLVFSPRDYPSLTELNIPPDNVFLGLMKGNNGMLVVTWPNGNQRIRLILDSERQEPRLIESVDIDNDGRSVYLALLDAPGIWHKEELKPSYLEKDVAINWRKPFPAKWKTQFAEAGVNTTYNFRESKQNIWRAIVGRYIYPAWFEGDNTFYRLGKKIPPEGESIIYFLERNGTGASVSAPVDIMQETLGRQGCDAIFDLSGRRLRTHHRRGSLGIRRAATCGCTAAIEVVFKAGQEVEKKDYVTGAVDDMVYFVTRHVERIGEYQSFARDMTSFLDLKRKSAPDLKPFLDSMEAIAQKIPQEYSAQQENVKTLAYAAELAQQTKALAEKADPQNLPSVLELGEKWRGMGGAQDELLGKFHSITRNLFQQAGYGCVNLPEAVEISREIRRRCRMCLRNPDGYEIWPDY